MVKNILDHYLRQALNPIQVRLYLAEILILSPSGMITRRFIPFSQSVEIGNNAYSTISQVSIIIKNKKKKEKKKKMTIVNLEFCDYFMVHFKKIKKNLKKKKIENISR
jgi:hypothetical protein